MEDHYIYKEFEPYLTNDLSIDSKYIKNRLIRQIIWYDKSSISKRNKYKNYTIFSIILTGIIPILSLFTGFEYGLIATILITASSGASATILSIVTLCEYQKLWIEYRSTCEILKSMLHRYFTNTGEFSCNDQEVNFNLLTASCEEYMTKEFQTWTALSHSCEKEQ